MLRALLYSCLIIVGFLVFITIDSQEDCSYSVDILTQKASGKIYTKKEICRDKDGEPYGTTFVYFDSGVGLPVSLFSYSSFEEKKFSVEWDESKKSITIKTLKEFNFWGKTTQFSDYKVRYASQ